MKKLNQYLKNRNFTLTHFLIIVTTILIFDSAIGTDGISLTENVFVLLREYNKYSYGEMFIFGQSGFYEAFLGLSFPHIVILTLFSFLCGFSSFKFLHIKSLAQAVLTFPKSRKTLYRNKVIIPLLIFTSATIISKVIVLIANIQFWGFSTNMLGCWFANTLITLQYVIIGFVAGILGRLFTGRTFEGLTASISLFILPKTIYFLISGFSNLFIYGYTDIISQSYQNVLFLDPFKHFFDVCPTYATVHINTPVPYNEIINAIFWLIVLIVAVILLKIYFCKKSRYETVGFIGRNKIINIINAFTLPTLCGSVILWGYSSYYTSARATENLTTAIVVFLAIVFASLIIHAIFTRKLAPNKEKLVLVSTIASVFLLITITTNAGGLGYEKRIPDVEEIDSMYIEFSVDIIEPTKLTNAEGIDGFFTSTEFTPYNYGFYSLCFETESDLKAGLKLHQTLIDNRTPETAESVAITYYLKNGNFVKRTYYYISEKAVDCGLSLWETESVKNRYKDILLNSEENITDELGLNNYNWDEHKICLSDGARVSIISKDAHTTPINDLSLESFNIIKSAINNDIHSLTYEQWFMPERTYGFIEFRNDYDVSVSYDDADQFVETYNYSLTIPVTNEMTHTLKALESLNLTEYLKSSKNVSKAYLIDTEDAAEWWLSMTSDIDASENDAQFFHSVQFDYINNILLISANNFGHPYYSETLSEISKEVSGEELEKLLEKGHQKYYCGTDSQLLFVWYDNLSSSTFVIPK